MGNYDAATVENVVESAALKYLFSLLINFILFSVIKSGKRRRQDIFRIIQQTVEKIKGKGVNKERKTMLNTQKTRVTLVAYVDVCTKQCFLSTL